MPPQIVSLWGKWWWTDGVWTSRFIKPAMRYISIFRETLHDDLPMRKGISPTLNSKANDRSFQIWHLSFKCSTSPFSDYQQPKNRKTGILGKTSSTSWKIVFGSPIEFQVRRCDPWSVCYKRIHKLGAIEWGCWAPFFPNIALATKCPFVSTTLT